MLDLPLHLSGHGQLHLALFAHVRLREEHNENSGVLLPSCGGQVPGVLTASSQTHAFTHANFLAAWSEIQGYDNPLPVIPACIRASKSGTVTEVPIFSLFMSGTLLA
jgi:hypothetical protein